MMSERIVSRKESMSPNGELRLMMQEDGDIIVTVIEDTNESGSMPGEIGQTASIEICTPFGGGGGSQRTWQALSKLMVAMALDNQDQLGRRGEFPGENLIPTKAAP